MPAHPLTIGWPSSFLVCIAMVGGMWNHNGTVTITNTNTMDVVAGMCA
jgi:hypothetical protein